MLGFPGHSPLLGETAEDLTRNNNTLSNAQNIGNVVASDQASIAWRGYLTSQSDVDWYRLSLDHQAIQSIPGINNSGSVWATIFDVDYADGMARPDLTLWVFDSAGRRVRTLEAAGTIAGGRLLFTWDGRNARGASVSPGLYFVRLREHPAAGTARVHILR